MADMNTLQQSLMRAKKVMDMDKGNNGTNPNQPVFGGSDIPIPTSSLPPRINESVPIESLEPIIPSPTQMQDRPVNLKPKAGMTEEKIMGSKLPDFIKQAMIESPIPDIPFGSTNTMTEDFVDGIREQMDRQGIASSMEKIKSSIPPTPTKKTKKTTLSSKNLKSVIKESVRELITEIVDGKLDEIASSKMKADESFEFRIGDTIFYGNITSTREAK